MKWCCRLWISWSVCRMEGWSVELKRCVGAVITAVSLLLSHVNPGECLSWTIMNRVLILIVDYEPTWIVYKLFILYVSFHELKQDWLTMVCLIIHFNMSFFLQFKLNNGINCFLNIRIMHLNRYVCNDIITQFHINCAIFISI